MIDLQQAGDDLVDELDHEPTPQARIVRRARARRRRHAFSAVTVVVAVAVLGGVVYHQTTNGSRLVVVPATNSTLPTRVTEPTVPATAPGVVERAARRFTTAHKGRVLPLTDKDISFAVMGGGGDKLIYTVDRTGTTLRLIDVYSLRVRATATTPPLSSLAFPTGAPLYATGATNTSATRAFVERLDEGTLEPVWRRPTAPDPVIAATSNLLWIQSGAALQRIDPGDGSVLASFILPTSNRVSLALTSDALYVATTKPGGGHTSIETRDPASGVVTSTLLGVEGTFPPELVPTPQGLWTVYPTGNFASMELYRVNGAVLTPARNVDEVGTNAARLAYDPALSPVLWLDRAQGTVACLDPTTASPIATITDHTQPRLIATDQSDVLIDISGFVGIFRAHDLCPRIAQ